MGIHTQFRVMLAATIDDNAALERLQYPMIGSPKVDGIRCFCHPSLGPSTRTLKRIANAFIRTCLSGPSLHGLDGEIVAGPITARNVFSVSASAVMSADGSPDFTYWVFDRYMPGAPSPLYQDRLKVVESFRGPSYVKRLPYRILNSVHDVLQFEDQCLQQGYEGIILRSPTAYYKYGRSTLREQGLMKLKRFADDEAVVIGFEPLRHNNNEPTKDAMGLQRRSSHQANLVASDTLGALIVEHPQYGQFAIGTGFDEMQRLNIWRHQEAYKGRTVTFKYQKVGVVDKPRFPTWKGFRPPGT